ncbi:TMP-TENI-domain-containing protein [Sodiomyces alkalinus F11]|uniref:TMP-TENI-domain-containing protein n=1 Tax=Sodiomyces alkalinus (strain CBS 110278 / VKM F-3762 / F11) TaxID=1314773 RepID=A0A3N2PWC0_SODAK|nr:TMP-TENI-domain-containing protein [Sodiomyces alkalinus F11]ROT38790.1 TMP-TENI-domain-containing protein [Sodiomyces alkalinus F11]
MGKPKVDYSLYLVTDSTPAILGDKDLAQVVEAAVKGGVTLVQLRDKTSDTGAQIAIARRLHEVTRRYGVPLLINDRVDVALAVGCEGVHVGQDDMDLPTARKLLGPDAIIGVSTGTVEEAITAAEQGADYLGIGTVFSTQTKDNTKRIIGTAGLRSILASLASASPAAASVPTVCIGGIKPDNAQRVIYQSATPTKAIDGVAVVSAIIAAPDPEQASRDFLTIVRTPPAFRKGVVSSAAAADVDDVAKDLVARVPALIRAVDQNGPLSHNMTNLVVQNFAANVALAVGASPIMANYGEEAGDLARLGGALVINMGTVTPEGLQNYVKALKAYNAAGRPVVFDPVGAGATSVRRDAVKTIMSAGYLDIIKGNEGEITTVLGEAPPTQQKGVDSAPSALDEQQRAAIVRRLAARERNVVLMTGATDVVSDGVRTLAVSNGHPLLGQVTGTGCSLGTVISAAAAAQPVGGPRDLLAAVVAALLHFEIAAEWAAARQDVQGPGTFVPAFLDELARFRRMPAQSELRWLSTAKVREIKLED